MISRQRIIPCQLFPSHGIRKENVGGRQLYIAEHSDPQLELHSRPGVVLRLGAGEYEFSFSGSPQSGNIVAPCIYVDYGQGYEEGDGNHLYLTWLGDQRWSGRMIILGKTRCVRLDPSVDVFESYDLTLTVRKVSSLGPMVYSAARRGFRTFVPGSIRRAMTRAGVTQRIAANIVSVSTRDAEGRRFLQGSAETSGNLPVGLSDDYWARISSAKGGRHAQYGAIAAQPATANPPAFLPIAYYLPQMHPFPENDAWWGRGFTEWTNVSKAVAQFRGHYQPKLPGELGFYDLRVPETMARQIELARLYGLHGFCFYYYWFGGKRLLEKPLDMFLSRKDAAFDFPFCLCWANENWTRRWDGAEHEVLMAQTHTREDHLGVIDDLITYFRDDRYIKVDGKPVVLIYRPLIIPDLDDMLAQWRERARECGFPDIYVVATNSFGFDAPEQHGFDALCGFPPHGLTANPINYKIEKINSNYDGWVFDYAEVVDTEGQRLADLKPASPRRKKAPAAYFPGLMVAWDNEARKPERGNVFHASTPALYRTWLDHAAQATMRINPPDRRFVFINAWNEWAEGAYLEPDRLFGYGYLAATADVVRDLSADKAAIQAIARRMNRAERKADAVICLHLFYPEMIEEFAARIKAARRQMPVDVILTVPDTWTPEDARRAVAKLKPIRFLPGPNRGRDVLPFLSALQAGLDMGYTIGCKLHSKKSPQRLDGDGWRHRLVDGLLGAEALGRIRSGFLADDSRAIAAPAGEFVPMTDEYLMQDNMRQSRDLLSALGHPAAPLDEFVAGTMFWFRFAALAPMAALGYTDARFGPELGQLDGTLAHAFERVFVAFVKADGKTVLRYKLSTDLPEEEPSS